MPDRPALLARMDADQLSLLERDYSTEQRIAFAKKGWAIPVRNADGEIVDGRYPIANAGDLDNAKHAIGRGKGADKSKIIAHINKRAKALGEPGVGEESATEDGDGEDLDERGGSKPGHSFRGNQYVKAAHQMTAEELRSHLTGEHDITSMGSRMTKENMVSFHNEDHESAKKHQHRPPFDRSKESEHVAAIDALSIEEARDHMSMSGKQLRQHLVDAHYTDPDMMADASEDTCTNSHMRSHGKGTGTDRSMFTASAASDLVGDTVELVEGISSDGTFKVKIIQPGWGSSGYYSPDLLKRDGAKAFPAGTHMYLDHPTATEASERPERTIKDLAAVTVTDPVYEDGAKSGPGLYARAKAFSSHRDFLAEIAPHTGTSIRARGTAESGEADGRKGPIIKSLSDGLSIDFVTKAGAGGKIVPLYEAYRERLGRDTVPGVSGKEGGMDDKELKEAQTKVVTLTEENTALKQENARLTEAAVLRDARDIVNEAVAKVDLPSITRSRIVSSFTNPPMKDGKLDRDALMTRIAETVKTEQDYLATATGAGAIRGMGDGSVAEKPEDRKKSVKEAFVAMGLDEKAAEVAAAGRD